MSVPNRVFWYSRSARTHSYFIASDYQEMRFASQMLADAISYWMQYSQEESNGSTDAVSIRKRQVVYCAGESWVFEGPTERDLRLELHLGH